MGKNIPDDSTFDKVGGMAEDKLGSAVVNYGAGLITMGAGILFGTKWVACCSIGVGFVFIVRCHFPNLFVRVKIDEESYFVYAYSACESSRLLPQMSLKGQSVSNAR